MSINIKAVNVGDGDCLIITLKKEEETRVVMIDGGDQGNEKRVLQVLAETLKEAKREAPDLLVCTHYDQDHIWGLIAVLDTYGDKIKKCWVHTPDQEYGKYVGLLSEAKSHYESFKQGMKSETIPLSSNLADPDFRAEVEVIIESYTQMKRFTQKLGPHRIIQPFAENNIYLDGFPEFKVIGPTEDFYKSFFKHSKESNKLVQLIKEYITIDETLITEDLLENNEQISVCDKLGKKSIPKVSSVNMVSIIISYEEDGKKYLFTGDAGIESFESILDYQNKLKNLFYLTVPHHAAQYNFSKTLIELTSPKIAFASAKGEMEQDGKVRRPHPYIIGCFKEKGIDIHLTQNCTDYLKLTEDHKVVYKTKV